MSIVLLTVVPDGVAGCDPASWVRALSNNDAGSWSTRLERRIDTSVCRPFVAPAACATPGTGGPPATSRSGKGGAVVADPARTGAPAPVDDAVEVRDGPRGAPRGGATLGFESSIRVDGWITRSGCARNRLIEVDAEPAAPEMADGSTCPTATDPSAAALPDADTEGDGVGGRGLIKPTGAGTADTLATWIGLRTPAANQVGALPAPGPRRPSPGGAPTDEWATTARTDGWPRRSSLITPVAAAAIPVVERRRDPSGPAARIKPGEPGADAPMVSGRPGPPAPTVLGAAR